MHYTLNQLRIFLKITETKSITKAAEELHLTQPAVSIQLKNFQQQFDIPLTELIHKKIYITDFGLEIAQAAKTILDQVNNINYKTLSYKGKLSGKLKISIVSTGKYIMPFFLSSFMNENSGVELEMDVTNKQNVIKSLEKNEVDFSLVSILPTTLQVDSIELLSNKLYLVGNESSKNSSENLQEVFSNNPIIFREKGSGTRQTMEQFIQKNKIEVPKKLELTSNEAVKQAVMAGLGYSIMPLIGIKNEIISGELNIINIKGTPITTTWHLIWLSEKKHSPAAQELLNYIREEKDAIIKHHYQWYDDFKI